MKPDALKEVLKEEMADLVEECFPKGECKERGKALVLSAIMWLLFEKVIDQAIASEIDEYTDKVIAQTRKELTFWKERCKKLDKRILALTKMEVKISDKEFDG